MINLEQVKLLEAKVAKAVEYVERLTKENAALHRQEAELHRQEAEMQARLESYQKRIDELEVLVMGFKDDQSQIEEGILAALDRLNQFEKAMEKSLKDKPASAKGSAKEPKSQSAVAVKTEAAKAAPGQAVTEDAADSDAGQTCFEIPEGATEDDIPDPLSDNADSAPVESGELDIF